MIVSHKDKDNAHRHFVKKGYMFKAGQPKLLNQIEELDEAIVAAYLGLTDFVIE